MSETIRMWDYRQWEEAGLDAILSRHEMEYVNQIEYGDGTLQGEWYIADDETRTIIYGTFGNDNSPGASGYTYAEVYGEDETEEYGEDVEKWMSYPEYLERDDEDEDCYDDDDEEETEEEAWQGWLREELNDSLPDELGKVIEDDITEEEQWECYMEAMAEMDLTFDSEVIDRVSGEYARLVIALLMSKAR